MSRRLISAEFVVSAVRPRDFPVDGCPEIALAGRSNVGKSSLINALVRSAVARTSAAPGKTRQVNVYRVRPAGGQPFYLMDLPGYGHAGGGEKARREFAALTALYFDTRTTPGDTRTTPGVVFEEARTGNHARSDLASPLRAVVLAIDARHPGLASDRDAWRWLQTLGVPFLLVATKFDKLSQSEKATLNRACEDSLGATPLPVSTVTGAGLDELWGRLNELTGGGSNPASGSA
jgi:GTP-binding protein